MIHLCNLPSDLIGVKIEVRRRRRFIRLNGPSVHMRSVGFQCILNIIFVYTPKTLFMYVSKGLLVDSTATLNRFKMETRKLWVPKLLSTA